MFFSYLPYMSFDQYHLIPNVRSLTLLGFFDRPRFSTYSPPLDHYASVMSVKG
jgi:hypothetical protein